MKNEIHSGVGSLIRNGKTVSYAYVNGQYMEGSAEVLSAKLTHTGAVNQNVQAVVQDKPVTKAKVSAEYSVHMSFRHPAWDEKNGYTYTVTARSKSEACKRARQYADNEGHMGVRYFKAVLA